MIWDEKTKSLVAEQDVTPQNGAHVAVSANRREFSTQPSDGDRLVLRRFRTSTN